MNITDKKTMYQMLDQGYFGNTIQRWYSLESWKQRTVQSPLWGIRSAVQSGERKKSRLDVPTDQVEQLLTEWYPHGGGEISSMVDHMLTARMQIMEMKTGLYVWIVQGKPDVKWREAFDIYSLHLTGVVALQMLHIYLNENSLDDLRIVLEQYPEHVIELTALDRCFGTVPGRNGIVWECRLY